jgi:hypothetical protein
MPDTYPAPSATINAQYLHLTPLKKRLTKVSR